MMTETIVLKLDFRKFECCYFSLNSLAHKSYKVYNLRIVFNVKPWHLDILHEPIQPRQNVSLCRLRSSQDSQAVER